jgi:hypothetical protein
MTAARETTNASGNATGLAGLALTFAAVEPWPAPVDGDALLDELMHVYTRYLVLSDGGSPALALWTLHTYVYDVCDVSPYLTLTSPQKRCGKSTVLMVASALVNKPLLTSNISAAALFRAIDAAAPTLLIDEGDTFLGDNEALRGILNSGHTKRTAFTVRTVGEEHEPRKFSTWAPKMLAGIGKLPDTLRDRSILLPMRRKKASETVTKWREREAGQYLDLRRRCVRWAADTVGALSTADPVMPESLSDRAADNWATLLAIADQAGGDWRQHTEDAITALTGAPEEDDDDVHILLLADLQRLFQERETKQVTSEALVEWLKTLEERPWAEYGKQGKPITPTQVARLLKPFGIRSKKIRMNAAVTAKGYLAAECVESFLRYLPSCSSSREGTSEQASNDATKRDFREGTEREDVHSRKTGFTAPDKACSPVHSRNTPDEESDDTFSFDPDDPIPF